MKNNQHKTTIRAYNVNDKPFLLQIIQLNTPTYFAEEEEMEFSEYLDTKIDLYFVVEINQQIVGCGGINFQNNKTIGIISWGMIHPDFQGLKIGKELLEHRIYVLRKMKSVQEIYVRTSQLVYPFYEKCGFKTVEIIEDYWAKGIHLYKMKYEEIN